MLTSMVSILLGFLFLNSAHSSQVVIPVEEFPIRYEKATVVVYGEVTGVELTEEKILEFSDFEQKFVKRGVLKTTRQWKGKKAKEVSFYFVNGEKFSEDASVDHLAKTSKPLRKGFEAILYLREISGKMVAQGVYGMKVHTGDGAPKLKDTGEYKALELMLKGKKKKPLKCAARNFTCAKTQQKMR